MSQNRAEIFIVVLLIFFFISGCKSDPLEVRDKYFASAEKYFAEQKYEEAIIDYRNALHSDQEHVPSHLGIAKAFQKMGNSQQAIAEYSQVIKLDGENIEARIEIGRYQIALGTRSGNPEYFKLAQESAEAALTVDPSNIKAIILLGNAYAGQNEIDKSMQEYEKALSLDPTNLQATLNLAAAHLQKNDLHQAEIHFNKALEDHPDSIEAHLAIVPYYSSTNNPQQVKAHIEKAFELNPADPRSLSTFVNFYLSEGKIDEAENVLKEAISREPEVLEPRLGLVRFYLQQGRIDDEITALNGLLEAFPGNASAQLRLAEISQSRGEDAKAEEYLRSVLKSSSYNAEAHFMLGEILRKRNENDKALEEFESAITLNESLAPAYLAKANLELLRGDFDACSTTLQTILKLNRNYIPARAAMAKLLIIQGKPHNAMREAEEVLKQIPNNEDALGARAEALRLLDRLDESEQDWLKLCEMQPQNASYWHRLGSIKILKNQNKSALQYFRKAVELKPDFIDAINDIVYLRIQEGQFNEILKELDDLGRKKSPKDEIHRFKGQVYLTNNNQTAAENEWKKAIELNPQNRAFMLLGQLYVRQNRIPQAIEEIDKLIAQNEKYVPAYLQKAYYFEISNDPKNAIKNYRKVLDLDSQNVVAANNLAWLLAVNDIDIDEAFSLAEPLKKKLPENPEIADTIGWIYYKMNNFPMATNQLLFSVNNRKNPSAENYFRLGMSLYRNGDSIKAKQTLRKALELDDRFDGAEEAKSTLNSL